MLEQINSILSSFIVPILLCASGIFYTIKLRSFHIFDPVFLFKRLRSEKPSKGVSSAKAVTLALAGTLGVGNIVGVSSAIHMGGFGSVFWMWISALLAMALKYAEIVLAMRYRKIGADGSYSGSAMYYIKARLSALGLNKLGRIASWVFAAAFLICSLTMGSMLQSSAISEALDGIMGIPSVITGAVMGILTVVICANGTRGVMRLTDLLVPIMSLGYAIMSLAVIISNATRLPHAFSLIVSSAFTPSAAVGGIGGFIFTKAVRYGVMRGLVSNEAGCGTAPTAHAIADCQSPARQGLWGIFEVFADTIILCTMTALVVILEYGEASKYAGNYMMMTLSAFTSGLGAYASYFLCAAVICFGFATILCWSHYGLTASRYFKSNKTADTVFILIYSLSVFLGACLSADLSWQLADISMGIMTVINLTVILSMWKEVRTETALLKH